MASLFAKALQEACIGYTNVKLRESSDKSIGPVIKGQLVSY